MGKTSDSSQSSTTLCGSLMAFAIILMALLILLLLLSATEEFYFFLYCMRGSRLYIMNGACCVFSIDATTCVQDLRMDNPDVEHLLSLFLGRAIIDEVLPPKFLTAVLPFLENKSLGVDIVQATGMPQNNPIARSPAFLLFIRPRRVQEELSLPSSLIAMCIIKGCFKA